MIIKYNVSMIMLLALLLSFPVTANAQEVMLAPVVSDETGEVEEGLSDYAVENNEIDIEPGLDSFAPLQGNVFNTLNARQADADVRFSSTKFREDSKKIPLGQGLKPAAQINIQDRLKRERAEKEAKDNNGAKRRDRSE